MRANTPELWDEIWTNPLSVETDKYLLAKEEHSIRWQRIEQIVLQEFKPFKGLKVIEIGAGAGTVSALMAESGADITLLDYSDKALERAREFFGRIGLTAQMVKADALALPADLFGNYDIATSFGLVEHFRGDNRLKMTKTHFDVLRPDGLAFISVPNKFNPPYRLFKFVATRLNKWSFGEEYPFSRWELRNIFEQLEVKRYGFFGDSLISSFDFINPFKALAVVRNLFGIKDNYDVSKLRDECGTFLDAYLSYCLVGYAKKL